MSAVAPDLRLAPPPHPALVRALVIFPPAPTQAIAPPRAYVVSGPSFVGKTTLARKIKRMLARHSSCRTLLVELPSLRRMIGPVTYGPAEDHLAYAMLLALVRQALELGMNAVAVAPCGAEASAHFRGQPVLENVVQIQVRCSLEAVLLRQERELSSRRRAYVGAARLREIHGAYRYDRLPWAAGEVEYHSERDPSRALIAGLRARTFVPVP